MKIDEIDFSILRSVQTSREPLWKKQVHREMKQDRCLENLNDTSVQTVGRRIDELHERGFLDPCIVNPDEINRDLMIAYELTDKGERALKDKRDNILRERAASYTLGPETEAPYCTTTVKELMKREMEISEEALDNLKDHSPDSLDLILTSYYLREGLQQVFGGDDLENIEPLSDEENPLSDIVSRGL